MKLGDATNPLFVYGDIAGYVARFDNDGNNANRGGLVVNAGADDGSGLTDYLVAGDGNADVVGAIRNNSGTFELYDASDERLKQNIKDFSEDGLSKINDLRVREFEYKKNPGTRKVGFIAQEVQDVIPAAVAPLEASDPDGMLSVSQGAMIPYLIKAVQDLTSRVVELETQLKGMVE